ncbi:MAG TPA: protein phosphatase 2C domain-containing protein [Rhizomicrobium sp.]|jgi:serine/threonine-protein phosphatase Stp1|nr:protein phosphatase 2C domain-containing protein [Rhizomicrobium sp.]
MLFYSVARTHVGCRRKVNEDAFLSRPEIGLWAVADGMGGHHAGEVASALIVDLLGTCQTGVSLPARMEAARAALLDANEQLIAMTRRDTAHRPIGSTVVAMGADAGSFACLWVGDSRAYLARDGRLLQLTQDHSLVQELIEIGYIDPSEARAHPNGNVITRAIGSEPTLNIDAVDGKIANGDAFLLTSDGLTRLVSDEEILASLMSADLESAADNLIDTCLARGAPDNVTFVILRTRQGLTE